MFHSLHFSRLSTPNTLLGCSGYEIEQSHFTCFYRHSQHVMVFLWVGCCSPVGHLGKDLLYYSMKKVSLPLMVQACAYGNWSTVVTIPVLPLHLCLIQRLCLLSKTL